MAPAHRTSQAQGACQLSFALSSCTPPFGRLHLLNLSGALFSLPPLGVVLRAANQDSNDCRWQSYLCFVPRSGKGGGVGIFELFPFNEPHPLSQPCRFRSAVKSASSPIGEPSGLLRIRLGYHEAIGACRNPSAAAAAAPLSGALGDFPLGLPAQLCIKQLYAALWSATPAKPFRGALLAAPFGGGAPRSESR